MSAPRLTKLSSDGLELRRYRVCVSMWTCVAFAAALGGCAPATQQAIYAPFYGADPGNSSGFTRLGVVDTESGEVSEVLSAFGEGYGVLPNLIASAAFDPDGELYTIVNGLKLNDDDRISSQLATVDMATGRITPIGPPHPINMIALEVDDQGQVYACGFDLPPAVIGDDHLYRIDKETGAAEDLGSTGIERIMDLALDADGNLYATSGDVLYTLDPSTGQVLESMEIIGVPEQWFPGEDGGLERLPSEVMTIAFDRNGQLHALAMRAFMYPALEVHGVPHGAPLLRIDPESGMATVVSWTGAPNFHGGDIRPEIE
jgi:hypothetical protein